jgi:hypothetical protein
MKFTREHYKSCTSTLRILHVNTDIFFTRTLWILSREHHKFFTWTLWIFHVNTNILHVIRFTTDGIVSSVPTTTHGPSLPYRVSVCLRGLDRASCCISVWQGSPPLPSLGERSPCVLCVDWDWASPYFQGEVPSSYLDREGNSWYQNVQEFWRTFGWGLAWGFEGALMVGGSYLPGG